MPADEIATNARTTKKAMRMLGLELHNWESVMLWSLGGAAIAAFAVVVATTVVVLLQREQLAESRNEFERYKIESGEKISDANAHSDEAKAQSLISAERIAELNNETEKLKGDNLALQRAMASRHVGIVGVNDPPKAHEWFAGIEALPNKRAYLVVLFCKART